MSPVDVAVVRRKLAVITRNLADLRAVAGLSLEDYRGDRMRLKATERLLQELIEAAIDTNVHVLRGLDRDVPAEYFRTFIAVGEAGVIPNPLARSLAPSSGLRNRLVHEYDTIDDAIVLEAVRSALTHYTDYVMAVEAFVSSIDA
ncbi:MAG: DUF86 domain-containing protein [Gemmatimonadetes bacterium]|nr:DUF86 domain-containing protein [Gemmatimonadota bacterium]